MKLEDAIEIARDLIEDAYTKDEYAAIQTLIEHAEKNWNADVTPYIDPLILPMKEST